MKIEENTYGFKEYNHLKGIGHTSSKKYLAWC